MTVVDTVKQDESAAAPRISPALIRNVSVELEAYLGDVRMTVAELTDLRAGAVITLDAALNQPVELRLNGVAVARGELVSVDDRFGVRLGEIVQWPE
jgi:flagellar motor switch protein FliN/FliY